MIFNYQEISNDFLKELPDRAKEVIVRRFGLDQDRRATLQAIGEDLGITRERVRQIQTAGLVKMSGQAKKHGPVFQFFVNQLKTTGNLRQEDMLFQVLSPDLLRNQVFFLLSLADGFDRVLETKDFHALWVIDKKAPGSAKKVADDVVKKLNKISQPVDMAIIGSFSKIKLPVLIAYLEASKIVQKGPQGLWGLRDWPEINPRGVRDRAHIIFEKEKKPLHFTKVAQLINESRIFDPSKKAHPQTVHNELIKDKRFVLVGRGLYALVEWGYQPGTVRDIIAAVLKEAKGPLAKEEIMEKVSKQRFVAKNTILLNLHNRKYFKRDPKGQYRLTKS